jgi:hypothetical protein
MLTRRKKANGFIRRKWAVQVHAFTAGEKQQVKVTLPRPKIVTHGLPYRQENGKLETGVAALFSSQARQVQIRHGSSKRTVNIIDATATSRPAGVSQPRPYIARLARRLLLYSAVTSRQTRKLKIEPYANCALPQCIFITRSPKSNLVLL